MTPDFTARPLRLLALAMMPLLLVFALPVAAQDPPDPAPDGGGDASGADTPEELRNIGVVANPNTRELLLEGQEFLRRAAGAATDEARRIALARAVESLQELISDERYRPDVILRHELKRFVGARAAARETLLRAGDEALEAYRHSYNAAASEDLRWARVNRKIDDLESVLLKYPFADAAVEAGIQASRLAWEGGELQRAAAMCRRLLEREDLGEADAAMLTAGAAACYAHLGHVEEAAELLEMAQKRYPTARVTLGHDVRGLVGLLRDRLEEAKQRRLNPDIASPWVSIAGNMANNKAAFGNPDPASRAWQERLPQPRRGQIKTFMLSYPQFELPRRFAVISDYIAFVPNQTGIVAFDLFNGQRLWSHHNEALAREFWRDETDPAVIYTATVDGDEVIAPLEVPMLDSRHDPDGVAGHHNGVFGTRVLIHAPRRQLTGLDTRTGQVRWTVGGQWDDQEAELHQALSYCTAPQVDGDTIYCAGARLYHENGHVYAVALQRPKDDDASDGRRPAPKLKWITKIISGLQETNLFGRPTREPFASSVAVQSHRMFICSNLGIVAALDTTTGEQLWSVPYQRIPFVPPVRIYPAWRKLSWVTNPPVVADGRVLFTPHDADKMFCYDVETGALQWAFDRVHPSSRYRDEKTRYLFGVRNGRVYYGGGRWLFELFLDSGRLSRNPLELPTNRYNGGANGRGVIVGDELFIPMDDSIVVVDLESLRVVRTIRNGLGQSGGNLCAGDGVMLAVSDQHSTALVSAAYDWDRMLAELKKLEAAHPDSFEIRLRIANLSRQQGRRGRDEAVRQFLEVIRRCEANPSLEAEQAARDAHRGLLEVFLDEFTDAQRRRDVTTMRLALRRASEHIQRPSDGVKVALLELELETFARSFDGQRKVLETMLQKWPTARYEFPTHGLMSVRQYAHIQLAELFEGEKKYAGALENWQQLIEHFPTERYRDQTMHRYASQRQRNIIAVSGRDALANVEKRAQASLTEATSRNDRDQLMALTRFYPVSVAAETALLRVALLALSAAEGASNEAMRDNELDQATAALRQLLAEYPQSSHKPQAYALLAEAYEKREMYHAARGVLGMLKREFGGQSVELRGRDVDVDDFVQQRLDREVYKNLGTGARLPHLADPPLQLVSTTPIGESTNPRILEAHGQSPAGAPARYFVLRNRRLECRDIETGETVWTNYDATYVYEMAWVGGRLVAVTTGNVVALEPHSGEIVWRVDLGQQVQEARIANGICAVILRKRRPQDQRISFSLTLINAEDGSRLGESENEFDVLTLAKPQIAGTMVLIHSLSPGRLIGFNVANPRTPAFERAFESRLASAPLPLDDQRVAVVTRESAIEILQINNGNLLHKFPVEGGVLTDRVFATDKALIYCDSTANVIAIDPGSGQEIWRYTFDRRDLIMQKSLTTDESLVLLHKATMNRRVMATALSLESGEKLWTTELGEDLRFDCQTSVLTTGHLVLSMRKIEARTVERDGTSQHEVIANLRVHILSRADGKKLQTIEPELGANLVPSVVVHDGSLFVSADKAILRYTR